MPERSGEQYRTPGYQHHRGGHPGEHRGPTGGTGRGSAAMPGRVPLGTVLRWLRKNKSVRANGPVLRVPRPGRPGIRHEMPEGGAGGRLTIELSAGGAGVQRGESAGERYQCLGEV